MDITGDNHGNDICNTAVVLVVVEQQDSDSAIGKAHISAIKRVIRHKK